MVERRYEYSPKSPTRVDIENERQYGEGWPWSADIRRHLTLEYSYPLRDMWSEMAKAVVNSGSKRVVEFGCSSGYIIRKMLEHGFDGEVIGIDKAGSYLPLVEEVIRKEFPDSKASITLLEADAQTVSLGELGGVPFDAGIAANILYHVPKQKMLFKSLNETVKDEGLAFFSTKDVDHQQEIWTLANQVANHYGAGKINSFYYYFPIGQMYQSLKNAKRFSLIAELSGDHHSETRIPNDQEGWRDFRAALLSLVPLMEDKQTGLPKSPAEVLPYIDGFVKPYLFERAAANNNGYFKGTVSMAWQACRNHKN